MHRPHGIAAAGLLAASLLSGAAILLPGAARADWVPNGIPITPAWGSYEYAVVASDGSSGEIVAYQGCFSGEVKILVQRIGTNGAALWAADGIALGPGSFPAIISDGAGGAIVAWESDRGGSFDIYAQRINAKGAPLWTETGIRVCAASGDQSHALLCPDASGGVYIAWWDARSGTPAIYAQRFDADGFAMWDGDGVPVCTAKGNRMRGLIEPIGTDGVVIVWEDYRGGKYSNVYAQRLNAAGAVQWPTDGVAVCPTTTGQMFPCVVPDGSSGAIIAWVDFRRASDVFAQRINASGVPVWAADGIFVSTAMPCKSPPGMITDGEGGAIVTWAHGYPFTDISAQRIDADGSVQWTQAGVILCMATQDQQNPSIVADGSGGAIVAWADSRTGEEDLYAQRIDAAGRIQWRPDGIAVAAPPGEQWSRWIVPDGASGAIVTWHEWQDGGDLHAQRIDGAGELLWTEDGAEVTPASASQGDPQMTSNGSGGAIVTYMQNAEYLSGQIFHIKAQVIDGSGEMVAGREGITICDAPTIKSSPRIASDGSGGAIIVWDEIRYSSYDIYVQRLDANGRALWTANGVLICQSNEREGDPQIIADGYGGAIIAWVTVRYDEPGHPLDYSIGAQRVSSSGSLLWGPAGKVVCQLPGNQWDVALASDGAGGAIIVWADGRSGSSYDIYAQRLIASGVGHWGNTGKAICTAALNQTGPRIAVDAAGWATIAWSDARSGAAWDIYAQRMNPLGVPQWGLNGKAISTNTGNQTPLAILPSPNGTIIAWRRLQGELTPLLSIYARCLSPAGATLWTATAVSGRRDTDLGRNSLACPDGAGGAIISWQDYSDQSYLDVYAQAIGADGAVRWGAEGVPVSATSGTQRAPCVTSDGSGGCIVAWEDTRCPVQRIYAGRVSAVGASTATTLMSYAAWPEEGSVRLEWTLAEVEEGAVFSVLRASAPAGSFEEIAEVEAEPAAAAAAVTATAAAAGRGLSFGYTDESCRGGESYRYRINYREAGGAERTLFETEEIAVPAAALALYQNYPNPFNPLTEVRFVVPEKGRVSLAVYDVGGRLVRVLVDGVVEAGPHVVRWDGRSGAGASCASGVYFCRLKAGKERISRKMLLLR